MKRTITFALCALLMLAFSLTSSAESTEISYGADYSLVTAASEAYPDDGIKLTDGIYGTHAEGTDGYYASGAYVGFNKNNVNESGNFAIILDLGQVYDNINELTVGYLSETAVGISAPQSVTFAVSEERNGNYTEIGTVQTTPEKADESATYAKSLHPENNAKGRFVLVTIKPAGYTDKVGTDSVTPWTFIDEISVHAASAPTGDTSADPSDVSDSSDPTDDNSGTVSVPTDDEPEDTPQTGDDLTIFAFVLLALAAFTMMIALFSTKRSKDF